MKYPIAILAITVFMAAGCIKAPDTLVETFWDPATPVEGLGTIIDTSYQINGQNERAYLVRFSIDWSRIQLPREDNIISVQAYNNGKNIPMTSAANLTEYNALFFAKPAATTCFAFGFTTSNGGVTRQFELLCVDVP